MADEARPNFLAMAETVGVVGAEPLTSATSVYALALMLSESSLLPRHVRCWQDLVLLFFVGSQLGLGPMESLRALYILEGRVGIDARYQLALLKRNGVKVRWIADGTSGRAELEMELPDDPGVWHSAAYTIEEARHAGLTDDPKKPAWQKHPAAMLRARAITKACAMHAPHLVSAYESDEMREIEAQVTDVTPAPKDSFLVREAKEEWGAERVNESIARVRAARDFDAAWWSANGDELKKKRDELANISPTPDRARREMEWIEEWVVRHRESLNQLSFGGGGQGGVRHKTHQWLAKIAACLDLEVEWLNDLYRAHDVWQTEPVEGEAS